MKNKKFIISDYQRQCSWDEEKCEILWSDLVNFYKTKNASEYFLGRIVTWKTDEGIEVIDGQQE